MASKLSLVISVSPEDDFDTFKRALTAALPLADELIIYALDLPKTRFEFISFPTLRIFTLPKPRIIEELRHQQVNQTKGDWVLILDADEVLSSQLVEEITQTLRHPRAAAYALPRHNYSLGYRIKRGGWSDDYQIRLISKDNFIAWPAVIHTLPQIKGQVHKLQSPIYHYKDPSLSFMVDKTNRYSEAEAELFYRGGLKPVTSLTLLRKMNLEIFRRGILKLGFLDGAIGIIQSIYQGFSVFITYAKLYEKQQTAN